MTNDDGGRNESMNRLTDRSKEIPLPCADNALFWARVHERLARYEDLGMEPEGVAALTSHPDHAYADYVKKMWRENGGMERMEKLAKAEAEGRLIVLPCKVGDTVFRVGHDKETNHENVIRLVGAERGQAAEPIEGQIGLEVTDNA